MPTRCLLTCELYMVYWGRLERNDRCNRMAGCSLLYCYQGDCFVFGGEQLDVTDYGLAPFYHRDL